MSRMAELALEIEDLLEQGLTPVEISRQLCVPQEWVLEVEYNLYGESDGPYDGFISDAEADADALASAGFGTDEDYGMDAYDSQFEYGDEY